VGPQTRLHVCLNIHRAPGYCINQPKEPRNLWLEREPQDVFARHRAFIARRYKGVPNTRLSFDLLNEPNEVDNPTYARVCQVLVEAIRSEDPQRLILADGTNAGAMPVPELIPLKIAQGTRGYQPMPISHHQASWFPPRRTFPRPPGPWCMRAWSTTRPGSRKRPSIPGKRWKPRGSGFSWGSGMP